MTDLTLIVPYQPYELEEVAAFLGLKVKTIQNSTRVADAKGIYPSGCIRAVRVRGRRVVFGAEILRQFNLGPRRPRVSDAEWRREAERAAKECQTV